MMPGNRMKPIQQDDDLSEELILENEEDGLEEDKD